jgi:phospho-N-acetylmuramoyl-pentapeptide-transferase
MGTIGFVDDYIKIFKRQTRFKRNFKVFGQVGLGLIVGTVLYFNPSVTVRTDMSKNVVYKQGTEQVETKYASVEENLLQLRFRFSKIMSLIMPKY